MVYAGKCIDGLCRKTIDGLCRRVIFRNIQIKTL